MHSCDNGSRAVLKTVGLHRLGGSSPSLCAIFEHLNLICKGRVFLSFKNVDLSILNNAIDEQSGQVNR